MRKNFRILLVASFVVSIPLMVRADERSNEPIQVGKNDWPWWRGVNRDGVAAADQSPPVTWSEDENVLWKMPIPGRGHGSPCVVGEQVFLAIADHEREVQAIQCLDRQSGKLIWETEVHRGGFDTKGNNKTSLASATVACDGKRLFINFLHDGAVYLTALTRDGKRLWQKKVTEFVTHQGFGASPALYESLVIVSADNKGTTGAFAAYDRVSGERVWKHDRPAQPNYTSPVILKVSGRDQLLFTGCDLVTSLDPLSGKVLWEVPGATTECVTTTVTDGERIFTSGGYPKNHLSAVQGDGTGKIAWENGSRVYVPSMLIREGYLYAVLDAGVAMCWNSATGKEQWKQRIGGTFSASPVLVGENIYATNEAGQTFVFKASPKGFEKVAENKLGEDVYATPTICGSRIYTRVATLADGKRQEWLYCLGKK